jgi:hypothetical protein
MNLHLIANDKTRRDADQQRDGNEPEPLAWQKPSAITVHGLIDCFGVDVPPVFKWDCIGASASS